MKIKIMIVDDHEMVISGLKLFLKTQADFEIVGVAHDGIEAVEKAPQHQPHVILMDLIMPNMNGIEATRAIKQNHPEIKIIVLTSFSEQEYVVPALSAGASGYLLKDVQPDQLIDAIRGAYNGNVQLHPKITSALLNQTTEAPKVKAVNVFEPLTAREKEVLELIAEGMSNKEIAAALVIAEKTVKTHVSAILSKLELSDRTQAALFAVKHQLATQKFDV